MKLNYYDVIELLDLTERMLSDLVNRPDAEYDSLTFEELKYGIAGIQIAFDNYCDLDKEVK